MGRGDDNPRIVPNLRYLSPSALDRRAVNGLEIDVEPVPDIFLSTPSVSTNRKRQLTEIDKQILPQSFRSDSVKRTRFLNRSLLEPNLHSSLNKSRLDATWSGELTANHSPASSITNFSFLGRKSGPTTTSGSLSTRTQEIFKKLEGTNTPAKEIQRMSMLRAGLSRPEKWATFSDGRADSTSVAPTPPPPLKKAADSIPSRIQLISKSMAMTAKQAPYWRDLTRKRGESKNKDSDSTDTQSLRSLNGNFATATELSSVFSLEDSSIPKTKSTTSTASSSASTATKKPHVSILKGPDGKPVSRNTFRLSDDVDDDDEDESEKLPPLPIATLSNPQPLILAPESAPKRGFLDNLSFSFRPPVDVISSIGAARKNSVVSSSESHKDVDSDSSEGAVSATAEKQTSAESSGGSSSSESEASEDEEESSDSEEEQEENEEPKQSRPHTSADTISTANGSNQSSKDSSPKVVVKPAAAAAAAVAPPVVAATAAAKWTCSECFTDWDQALKDCGCCGTPRAGASAAAKPPAEKKLVSNLSSFAPAKSGFSFGFGTGPAATSTTTALPKPTATNFGTTATPPVFGANKPAAPAPPAPPAAAPAPVTEGRVDWMCPDCCVSNKAADDKCPCCGHVKYASAADSSSNVFGNRAFKPLAAPTGAAPVSFGFGAAKPAQALAPAATVAPAPSLFGNVAAKPVEPVAAPKSTVPLFGASTSSTPSSIGGLFGGAKPAAEPAPAPAPLFSSNIAKPAEPAPPSTTPSLFGSGTSLFSAAKPAVEPPKLAPTLSFGAPTTSEPPKTNLFGNLTSSITAPPTTTTTNLFGSGSTTMTTSLFSAKPAETPMFGAQIKFGGDVGTTTTDGGGVPAKRSMFSTDSPLPPKLAAAPFGGEAPKKDAAPPAFGGFGTSNSTGSLFGGPSSSTTPATSLFGGPATSTSTTIPAFGSSGTIAFGGAPTTTAAPVATNNAFSFGKQQPGMSTSSSTNSLFSQATAEPVKPFSTTTTNGFNFGGSNASTSSSNGGSTVFQFGSSAPSALAPSAAPGGAFHFGATSSSTTAPAPGMGTTDNAFSYQAPTGTGGARKMAMARRRNIRK
uniref:RanBP2-type domain-containing protein n=1 Tax=Caenorhabditis japonica TaxID=281687 RepID=A0A8R1EER8_CAEJA